MSDLTQDTKNNSTTDIKTTETDTQETSATSQKYSKEDLQKILDENRTYKAKAKELEKKVKDRETQELVTNQKWQELAELREKEANEFKEMNEKLKSAFILKEKKSALVQAALQAGMRKEAIDDLRPLDYPELKLETNGEGEFSVSGADKAIQRLKAAKSYWFQSAAPNVNTTSPSVTGDGKTMTLEMLKEIDKEYKKKPSPATAEKLKNAMNLYTQSKRK